MGKTATAQQMTTNLYAYMNEVAGIPTGGGGNFVGGGASSRSFGTAYSTSVGAASPIASVNGGGGASGGSGGYTLMPKDITSSLTALMRTNASNLLINDPWYFRDKVKNKGDWDLKNVKNGEYNRADNPQGFIFNGIQILSDAPGNIHYGYVGSAAIWTTPDLLFQKAGEAQKATPGNSKPEWNVAPYYGDDPSDTMYIQYGMALYGADNK